MQNGGVHDQSRAAEEGAYAETVADQFWVGVGESVDKGGCCEDSR